MSNRPGLEDHYKYLSNYAKSKGLTFTVGNPGTGTLPSYLDTVDNIVIYEHEDLSTLELGGWYTDHDKSRFSILLHSVSSLNPWIVTLAFNHVGYIYITDDTLPDPWDTIPPYFDDMVSLLNALHQPAIGLELPFYRMVIRVAEPSFLA